MDPITEQKLGNSCECIMSCGTSSVRYRNGQDLHKTTTGATSTLFIENVDSRAGSYRCRAVNQYGSEYSQTSELTVIGESKSYQLHIRGGRLPTNVGCPFGDGLVEDVYTLGVLLYMGMSKTLWCLYTELPNFYINFKIHKQTERMEDVVRQNVSVPEVPMVVRCSIHHHHLISLASQNPQTTVVTRHQASIPSSFPLTASIQVLGTTFLTLVGVTTNTA